ncbi:hypothetical protein GXB81_22090 [Paraburkholderia sp. Ac-20336]|uniref:hypothetical protein n=1 Tax=Burkholderiaceae TaxID=119060 RepID=UPI00141E89A9|nr:MULTISPECIES: hypothetical protein [Burkholderiaceae]MBN3805722.1 hypothetical protein [Paraburkholderia sp. Ac-20336]NIF51279.1 hypothetical protein [Burkholderia sp. Ax-1724]NIF77164.1 hypothetical protein [Paraburkholderia sp. Cy-641]
MSHSRSRWMSSAIVAALAIGVSSAAFAHVDVGVNIGIPGVVVAPPPPVYVQPAPVYVAPPPAVVIAPGWYGDRYYDGHRYWGRDEWEHHHEEWHGDRHDNGWHGRGHDHDDGWHGHGHDHDH